MMQGASNNLILNQLHEVFRKKVMQRHDGFFGAVNHRE
jgi:hypothetical protein